MLSDFASLHVSSPRNQGILEHATHNGQVGIAGEGPYVHLWLVVAGDVIREATYVCNGCPSMIASASVITELFKGRTVDQARRLTKADLLLILGGLPDGKESCAEMAVNALQLALTSKEGN